jgi:hypothetical protein
MAANVVFHQFIQLVSEADAYYDREMYSEARTLYKDALAILQRLPDDSYDQYLPDCFAYCLKYLHFA